MLKPLLLLCCAAIFVSAGDQDVILDHTNGPINAAGSSSAINPQLPIHNNTPVIDNTDTYAPSIQDKSSISSSELPISHPKPTTSTTTTPTTHITDATTVTPKPTTKPTTTSTTTTTTTTTPPTTTPSTTTSTTVSTSTAPAPTPLPPPSTGKWIVTENKTSCVIVQVAVQFNVSYTDVDNATIYKEMDIPSNGTQPTGKCGKTEQNLTLSWEGPDDAENNFTLHFVKNETEKHYSLHHLEISLVPGKTDKSNKTITLVHMAPQFETTLGNSYRCLKEQKLALTLEGKNKTVGHLKVSNLQFQAFRSDNTTIFGLAKDCSFDTPDIVPITVGCALAGLVVIVLIAYLVGRRRSQARGYLSM